MAFWGLGWLCGFWWVLTSRFLWFGVICADGFVFDVATGGWLLRLDFVFPGCYFRVRVLLLRFFVGMLVDRLSLRFSSLCLR